LEQARQALQSIQTIAVVGLSPNPERPSHRVARYCQECGYRIIPVRPGVKEILGEKAYPSLKEIPYAVDLVNIFRRAEFVPQIVEQAIARGDKVVWMQQGICHSEAAAAAQAAGLIVVQNLCLLQVITPNSRARG
jgi:hypothetical protein